MKLLTLDMNNWRIFYGVTPEIKFSTDPTANATVFHASNNSGKTNLLNALLWLFYKEHSPNFQWPEQLINTQAIMEADVGEMARASVTCTFEHAGVKMNATREVTCLRKETLEESLKSVKTHDLKLLKKQINGDWTKDPAGQTAIDGILPPGIMDFFFFDGEELKKKFEHDQDRQKTLAKQLRRFFGISTLEDTQVAFKRAGTKLRAALREIDDEGLQRLIQERERIEEESRSAKEAKDDIDLGVRKNRDHLGKIGKQLEKHDKSREQQTKRKRLESEREKGLRELEKTRKQYFQEISINGYTVFLGKPLVRLQGDIEKLEKAGQLPSEFQQPFIQKLLDSKTCICNSPLKEGSEEYKAVEAWLSKGGLGAVDTKVIGMSTCITQIQSDSGALWTRLNQIDERKRELEDGLLTINTQLSLVEDDLRNIDDAEILRLEEKRVSLQDAIDMGLLDSGSKSQTIKQLEDQGKAKDLEIKHHQARDNAASNAQKKLGIATAALDVLSDMFKDIDAQTRHKLLKKIETRFDQLTVNKFLPKLTEDYRLSIVTNDENQSEVPMSGGQMQALAFAFIGSIIEIQKEKVQAGIGVDSNEFPVVTDSPFGALGSLYRKNVVEYIPGIADQFIALVTDTQWEGAVEEEIAPIAGKSYVLTFHASKDKNIDEEDLLKKVTVGGRAYPYMKQSQSGYEWTEIKEVSRD